LRHQIGVLQRSLKKHPKLTSMDRLLWVSLSRIWRDWRYTLAIVKPQTVEAFRSLFFLSTKDGLHDYRSIGYRLLAGRCLWSSYLT